MAHGFSCLCALILITFQRKTIRPDRIFSIVNAVLIIAVLVYGSLSAENIPWVGFADTPWQGPHDHSQKGLATYCSDYTGVNDAMITFKRCCMLFFFPKQLQIGSHSLEFVGLQNGTWLGLVIVAALWCALGLFVYIQTSSMIFQKDEFALVCLDHHPSQAIMTSSPSEEAARHFETTMPLATNGAEYPIYNNAYDSFDAFRYPNHPMQPYIPHLQGRQMSGSFDSSGSNSMYHNIPPYGHYSNYEEKVAVSTPPSELSVSEPPHSHDDARV